MKKILFVSLLVLCLPGCVSYQTSTGTRYSSALNCSINFGADLYNGNASINCGN